MCSRWITGNTRRRKKEINREINTPNGNRKNAGKERRKKRERRPSRWRTRKSSLQQPEHD